MNGTPLLLGALLLAAAGTAREPAAPVRVTFIGNMGLHLTDGKVAILVDFPYTSGAYGYMTWSKRNVPSGPRPLCLFTHSHADHFDASLVPEYCGAVLGPKDVARGDSVTSSFEVLEVAPVVEWKTIRIRPQATTHSDLEHYSYLLEWAGQRLHVTGDTEDTASLLAARDLDAAFVTPWLLALVRDQGGRIDARRVVVVHHRAGETVPDIEGRIVPAPGQRQDLQPRKGSPR